jgi:hypothetical protein
MRRSLADLLGIDPAEPSQDEIEERHEIVERLNLTHAYVAGKGVIREDEAGGFQIESVHQFYDWYSNDGVWSKSKSGADIFTSSAKIWMQSRERRQFQRIVLDPRGRASGAYNLWRGFSVEPSAKGDCGLFLDHLHDNVCDGDKALCRWLVGWMAHLIQRPWEKPGTAVVFKGKPGVGKSTVGEHLGALIARHYVTVSTPRGLMGQFNAHLGAALLVQVEEGFWAGDKAAESDLRHKITGPTFNLERKGQDIIELPSFHRYLITSNERWTVPAQHDERRYAIFNVSDARMKDHDYFGAIAAEMKAGGYRALMRHLLDFDLSRVDVRSIPHTEALAAEKITGLRGVRAWWHEVLAAGELPAEQRSRFDSESDDWRGRGVSVRADDLRTAYEQWVRARRHHGDVLTANGFGCELKDMCPSAKRVQRREGSTRPRFYELPPLAECRADFAKWLNSEVDWS